MLQNTPTPKGKKSVRRILGNNILGGDKGWKKRSRGKQEFGLASSGRAKRNQRQDQDPRRRVIPEIELAIVSETKATIANARMTTTTVSIPSETLYLRAGQLPNSTYLFSDGYG
jgi:hypothetical protein